jgi:hypothetical protein
VISHLKRSYARIRAHRHRRGRSESNRGGAIAFRAPVGAYSVDTQSETVCLQGRKNSVQPQRKISSIPLTVLDNGNCPRQQPSTDLGYGADVVFVEHNIDVIDSASVTPSADADVTCS